MEWKFKKINENQENNIIDHVNKEIKTNNKQRKTTQLFNVITKQNNYKCSYNGCEKSFKEKGNLKIHTRTHVIKLRKKIYQLLMKTI